MARNHDDPNFAFWTDLKKGYDFFEVTRREPRVSYCGGHYVFDADFQGGEPRDPLRACPPTLSSGNPAVAQRTQSDRVAMEQLLSNGAVPPLHAYVDGGMHALFRRLLAQNGQKALASQTSMTAVPISRPAAALADPSAVAN